MLVKMLQTAVGANDGINAKEYEKGNYYELSDGLTKCFIEMKVAVPEDGDKQSAKAKAVDERRLFNMSMKELANKDAAEQLSNKKGAE